FRVSPATSRVPRVVRSPERLAEVNPLLRKGADVAVAILVSLPLQIAPMNETALPQVLRPSPEIPRERHQTRTRHHRQVPQRPQEMLFRVVEISLLLGGDRFQFHLACLSLLQDS